MLEQIKALKKDEKRLKNVAYIIHDKLHLSYAQCVHGLKTNNPEAMLRAANRNIVQRNRDAALYNAQFNDKTMHKPILSEFDANTFIALLIEQVSFGLTAKN